MSDKLLPCPFCGSTDIVCVETSDREYTVICRECLAGIKFTNKKKDAVDLWNRRADRVGCYVPMRTN